MKYKQFDDTIFTNETAVVELLASHCGDPIMKHDCISCCIESLTCNTAYIAYKNGINQVDWCQLYNLQDFEITLAANPSTIPEYWIQKWMQNGGQPTKSQLAVFGKVFLKKLFFIYISKWSP